MTNTKRDILLLCLGLIDSRIKILSWRSILTWAELSFSGMLNKFDSSFFNSFCPKNACQKFLKYLVETIFGSIHYPVENFCDFQVGVTNWNIWESQFLANCCPQHYPHCQVLQVGVVLGIVFGKIGENVDLLPPVLSWGQ